MEGEEGGRHEPVVHRVQRGTRGGAQNDHHREEEQQAHRREERDPRGEGSGIQLLGQRDADRLAGQQVGEVPLNAPAIGRAGSLGGRHRAGGEVDVHDVGVHRQLEVAHAGRAGGCRHERIRPRAQAAGPVAHVQRDHRVRRHGHRGDHLLRHVARQRGRLAVHGEHEVVEQRVLGGQREPHAHQAFNGVRVAKRVGALEGHGVGGVPQQALSPVLEVQIGRRPGGVHAHADPPYHGLGDLAPRSRARRAPWSLRSRVSVPGRSIHASGAVCRCGPPHNSWTSRSRRSSNCPVRARTDEPRMVQAADAPAKMSATASSLRKVTRSSLMPPRRAGRYGG